MSLKTLTDYLEGPVPFFHEFFDAAKNTLHEDFPSPGVWSIEREGSLVLGDEDNDKKKKVSFDLAFQAEGKETNMQLRQKFRLPHHAFGQVTFTKGGNSFFGLGITPAVQFTCPEAKHALTVDINRAVYQYVNPTFAVHARSNFREGGVPLHVSLATCLCPRTFAGFSIDYDALRSGMRSFYVAVQHTSADGNCIGTVSFDGLCNPGLTVSHCVSDKVRLLADVLPWGQEPALVGGIEYLAHGNNSVLLRGDWLAKLLSLAATFELAGLKVGVSTSWEVKSGMAGKDFVPKLGMSFSA